jgi:hypothetical protein
MDVQMVGASLSGTAMVRNLENRRFRGSARITIRRSFRACCCADRAAFSRL